MSRGHQELDGAKDLPAMLDVLVEKLQLLEVPREYVADTRMGPKDDSVRLRSEFCGRIIDVL